MNNSNNETTNSSESRSEAQREASRQNGKHSNGPTSEQGKSRSSQNSTTHGLRSSRIVLINESQDRYDSLLAKYRDIFKPIGQIEYDSLVQMVNAQWRIRRVQEMEGGIIDGEIAILQPAMDAAFSVVSPGHRHAEAILGVAAANPAGLTWFERAESRLQRILDRAMKTLIRLQTLRLGHPPKLEYTSETSEPETDQRNYDDPATFSYSLVFQTTPTCPTGDRRTWVPPVPASPADKAA